MSRDWCRELTALERWLEESIATGLEGRDRPADFEQTRRVALAARDLKGKLVGHSPEAARRAELVASRSALRAVEAGTVPLLSRNAVSLDRLQRTRQAIRLGGAEAAASKLDRQRTRLTALLARLVEHRNRLARDCGYADFANVLLAADEIEPRIAISVCRDALAAGDRSAPGPGGKVPALATSGDALLRDVRSVAAQALERIGVDEPGRVRICVGSFELPAICVPVRVPRDIRIFFRRGEPIAMDTVLHEVGHAAGFLARRGPRWSRRDAVPWDEAQAQVIGAALRQQLSLESGVPEPPQPRPRTEFFAANGLSELALYRSNDASISNPDGGPIWARVQTYERPLAGLRFVLADAVAAQLRARLQLQRATDVLTTLQDWLKRGVWSTGAATPWNDKLRDLTGHSLSATHLMAELHGAS
jgi:hypothetical protein